MKKIILALFVLVSVAALAQTLTPELVTPKSILGWDASTNNAGVLDTNVAGYVIAAWPTSAVVTPSSSSTNGAVVVKDIKGGATTNFSFGTLFTNLPNNSVYNVRAYAYDFDNIVSDWSDPLLTKWKDGVVSFPKNLNANRKNYNIKSF
jgi:hypothetical protein